MGPNKWPMFTSEECTVDNGTPIEDVKKMFVKTGALIVRGMLSGPDTSQILEELQPYLDDQGKPGDGQEWLVIQTHPRSE
jgi:hypothetical protein